MAAVLAGEAAVRIVPTLKGFHSRVDSELKSQPHSLEIKLDPKFAKADAEMDAWRKRQELNAINVPVRSKTDFAGFQRDITQVEHIFKRSSLSEAIRLNIKVIGLDALPALAYAAGSAASGLDALGKSAFALPGILAGALSSAGALAVGLHGVSAAFQAYGADAKNAADNSKKQVDADRELGRAKRDLVSAIRDQKREIEDLNSELHRSSLNEADALLSVQESVQRLREGGFKNITEFQRAQLGLLQSVDHLNEVRTNTARTAQDAATANADGIANSNKVVDALDRVAKATEAQNASKITEVSKALAKLSPEAHKAVDALHGLSGEWKNLVGDPTQDALFQGLDKAVTALEPKLKNLGAGLSGVAQGLNTDIKAIISSVGSDKNTSLIDRIFGSTKGGLQNAGRAFDPLISGVLRLSQASSEHLPRLGDAAARVFGRFDTFIEKIANDGSLDHWIDQGLNALTSLGNAATNVVSIVDSIAQAFDAASGTSGGFIGSLERGTEKLADFLKSPQGQNTLTSYFERAKEFVGGILGALRPIRQLLGDAVDIAREWSSTLLGVAGAFAQVAGWVEKNTGLLKPLLLAYLTVKTFKPIVEGLTGAWKNYGKVVGALADFGPTSGAFSGAQRGLQQFNSQIKAVGGVAPGATSALKLNAEALKGVNKEAFAALSPANNLTKQFGKLESAAFTAGGKVGTTSVGGLGKALLGLGAFIAPTALFTGAIIGLTTLVTQLGKAHAQAAADADKQKASLDGLKGSIDNVTGAATTQTLNQNARDLKGYSIPGLGNRDVGSDSTRANLGTPDQILAATIPTQQGARNDILQKADAQTEQKIAASDTWKRFQDVWQKHGVDLSTLAKAANGDPAAKSVVDKAMHDIVNGRIIGIDSLPDSVKQPLIAGQRAAGNIPDDLTGTIKNSGAFDSASTAIFIRDRSQAAVDQGNLVKGASDLANGRGNLNAAGKALFGADGSVTIGPQGNAIVQTSHQPNVPPEAGTVTKTAYGWQVELTDPGTAQYVQKFATGGLVNGKGSGTSDSNMAMLSKGEWVTKKKAVDHYGQGFFDDLNSMRLPKFSTGGPIKLDPNWAAPGDPGYVNPSTVGQNPLYSRGSPGGLYGDHPGADQGFHPSQQWWPSWTVPQISSFRPAPGFAIGGGVGLNPFLPNPPPPPAPAPSITPSGISSFIAAQKPALPNVSGTVNAPGAAQPSGFTSAGRGIGSFGSWFNRNLAGTDPSFKTNDLSGTPTRFAGDQFPRSTLDKLHDSGPASKNPFLPAFRKSVTPSGFRPAPPPPPPPKPVQRSSATTGTAHLPSGSTSAPGPHHGGSEPGTPTLPGPGASAPVPISTAPVSGTPVTAPIQISPGIQAVPTITSDGQITLDMSGSGALPDTKSSAASAVANAPVIPQANILAYLTSEARASGLQAGSGPADANIAASLGIPTHDNDGAQHSFNRALDIGNASQANGGQISSFVQQWMSDPTKVASTRQLIFRGPDGDYGIINGRVLTGAELQSVYGGDLGNHTDHVHLALEGVPADAVQNATAQAFPSGDGSVPNILSGLGINPSVLNGGGTTGQADIGGRIAAAYENALKPDNIKKFLDSEFSNIGQGLSSAGLSLLSGFTGLDLSSVLGGGQDLANNFLGSDKTGQGDPAITDQVSGDLSNYINGKGATSLGSAPSDPTKAAVYQAMLAAGLPASEWPALEKLVQGESSWKATNTNPSSGAFGLFQFLGHQNDQYGQLGGYSADPAKQAVAGIQYIKDRYGTPSKALAFWESQNPHYYASGGLIQGKGGSKTDSIMARVSRGEFIHNAAAVKHYGPGLFAALNSMQVPKNSLPGFAGGGWWNPILPAPAPAPGPGVGAAATSPLAPPPPQATGPLPQSPPPQVGAGAGFGLRASSAPSTGGAPGPGATAPAPEPSPLPKVGDALSQVGNSLGTAGSGQNGPAQPGADPSNQGDNRGNLGAAPPSGDHLNPALSSGIKGAFSTAGALAGTAASAFPGGGAAASLIGSGAQIAGDIASGAANIFASLAVGTLTGGSTAQASGVPLLPQRQPMQTGVPQVVQNDNRQIHVSNMDEYTRMQERKNAQMQNPFLSKF